MSPDELAEAVHTALAFATGPGRWDTTADIAQELGVSPRLVAGALMRLRHRGVPIEWEASGSARSRVRLAEPGTAVPTPTMGPKPQIITIGGVSDTVKGWVARSGISKAAFYRRLKRGETDLARLVAPRPRPGDTTLLHCETRRGGCGDMVRVGREPRECACGQSRARLLPETNNIELRGPCRALDLNADARRYKGQWRESDRVKRG